MNVRDLYNDDKLNNDDKATLNVLARKIKEGKVVLFLGAAVHCPPPIGFEELYPENLRPPLGRGLAVELAKEFPTEIQEMNLSWIAQYYESAFEDRQGLIKTIAKILKGKKPSPLVNALAQMNFRFILTTNYDNLYENALKNAGKKNYIKGIYKPNKDVENKGTKFIPEPTADVSLKSVTPESPFIYKIHGDIENVFNNSSRYVSQNDAIVITDEDYIQFIFRMGERDTLGKKNYNPIPSAFTKVLADPNDVTVLFIGYSLLDYNLRLLLKSTMWKKDIKSQLRKWSIDLKPDRSIKSLYNYLYTITFIEKDAWVVVPYLYEQIFKKEMPVL
jgi:hypothetical protein